MKRDSQFVTSVFDDSAKKKKCLYSKFARSSVVMSLLQERYHVYFVYMSMMTKMTSCVLSLHWENSSLVIKFIIITSKIFWDFDMNFNFSYEQCLCVFTCWQTSQMLQWNLMFFIILCQKYLWQMTLSVCFILKCFFYKLSWLTWSISEINIYWCEM